MSVLPMGLTISQTAQTIAAMGRMENALRVIIKAATAKRPNVLPTDLTTSLVAQTTAVNRRTENVLEVIIKIATANRPNVQI